MTAGSRLGLLCAAAALMAGIAAPVSAESVAEFYQNKKIRLILSTGEKWGGTVVRPTRAVGTGGDGRRAGAEQPVAVGGVLIAALPARLGRAGTVMPHGQDIAHRVVLVTLQVTAHGVAIAGML